MQHAEKISNGKSLVFKQETQEQGLENIRLHEKLQHAIANDEFHMVMQPIVNLNNQGSCNEGECLIRWQTPDEGFISPIKFISLAEESGLTLTKSFNVPQVAEGVETLEMVEKLQEMGCELVQGDYFSRPLPFDDFTATVNRG